VTGYETTIWLGLFAPANTPQTTVVQLNKAIREAVNSAEYKDKLAFLDMQPVVSSPQELTKLLKADTAKWAKVVKDAGIKPE
jgi:tripartite-type tricarboxylate transporter receptor subunit TctC